MVKSFCLQIVRLVVLTLLIAQVTLNFDQVIAHADSDNGSFRNGLAQAIQASPSTPTMQPTESVEIITPSSEHSDQADNQRVQNREDNQRSRIRSQASSPRPTDVYDRRAIEEFDRELYGEGR